MSDDAPENLPNAVRNMDCPKHGAYESEAIGSGRYVFWSRCPTCQQQIVDQEAKLAREAREEELHKRLSGSGLMPRFRGASFETFAAKTPAQIAARTTCRSFVESLSPRSGLWLVGPPGTGKTHLACAMVNHAIREQGKWAAIHSAREIVQMLRASWGDRDSKGQEAQVLADLGGLHLLAIDEVGVGFGSDSEMVQLFDVIDMRYRNELPTVVLSNLPAAELKPVLGDAAYDRLREGASIVRCTWASHRAAGRPS